jgi:AcrR family transcriptional regulator
MKNDTKKKLLDAFDESRSKTIAEACLIAGVAVPTFYFHFYKDTDFKRQILERRREKLTREIEATA